MLHGYVSSMIYSTKLLLKAILRFCVLSRAPTWASLLILLVKVCLKLPTWYTNSVATILLDTTLFAQFHQANDTFEFISTDAVTLALFGRDERNL